MLAVVPPYNNKHQREDLWLNQNEMFPYEFYNFSMIHVQLSSGIINVSSPRIKMPCFRMTK